jgi:hypothetical protein
MPAVRRKEMKKHGKSYQTQWAGQFGVAHELTRRGYLVMFTVGNAPATDLLCKSPNGVPFSVEVKSLSSKNYFPCQSSLKQGSDTRYMVFVYVPMDPTKPPEYFVLDNEQFLERVKVEEERTKELEAKRGKPYAPFSSFGFSYKTIACDEFKNWDVLPK